MASFAGLLLWWLLSVALSAVAWPLSYRLFSRLPDRGLGFSRLVGWLVTGYAAWLMGFAFNHALTSIVAWLLLAALSAWVWTRQRRELRAFAKENSGLIFVYEAVFLGLFLVWSLVRMKHSNIEGQEKFMDFAFFNAIQRSPSMPPLDPWLAAPRNFINYYYFGYFLNVNFARLLPISADLCYNLAVSNNFALCGLAALSLGYNLTRALWPGLAGMAALIFFGNLHGAMQLLGIQWQGAFNWWEPTRLIKDVVLNGRYVNAWWWSASPAVLAAKGLGAEAARDGLISEFPAFSFLHGDLHPHFTALPLGLLVLGLGLNLVKDPENSLRPLSTKGLPWILLGLSLGSLFMANTWDIPAYGLLSSLLLLVQLHRAGDLGATWLKQWLLPSVLLVVALLVLALPFLLYFQNPAKGVGFHGARTGLHDSLIFWGLFLAALAPFVWQKALALTGPSAQAPASAAKVEARVCTGCGVKLRAGKDICGRCGTRWQTASIESAPTEAPLWARSLTLGLLKPMQATGSLRWFGLLLGLGLLACFALAPTLGLFLGLATLAALILAQRGGSAEGAFAAALVLVGSLCVLLPEVAYLKDVFEGNPSLTRMNTVFKFYFQAWVFFAAALPLALHWTYGQLKGRGLWRPAYFGLVAALGLAAMAYPVKAVAFVWSDWDNWSRLAPTLDGAAWMQRDMPGDYAAIQRMRKEIPGQPVVAEAVGGAYTRFARVSAYTGFKAVIGWGNHESQWRKEWPQGVEHDMDEFFTTTDLARAMRLISQYQIDYIYVGQLEREKYGASGGLEKFSQVAQPVIQELGVTVYRVNK